MKIGRENYIRRLKKGKEDALEFIMEEYLPLVKGIASQVLRPVGSRELVEECISDIFLSLWHHAKKFRGENENDFRKWVCAIAKYKSIDYYRKEIKRTEILFPEGESDYTSSPGASAEAQAIFNEGTRELEKLLNSLSSADRSILIMKFFWGMTSEEISKKLGMTKSAVDNRIYRGKKQLVNEVTQLEAGGL
ncbi:sigma-70 family RNA polymerase sigma factor [Aminipila butyrica]|uniref:Sigma-70 family RNA polymerase sigma factor n=1 Tax=Aminipila butyrica TaxID=433296 RepID=A0A858BQG9_9FIRM|nr:sigma-70 family RNA polymerase sigma factor [Aminipila butyrica]QIB68111.1 sigma-70 family RNA polymerase sigma factor [Aminipila butyrica]